MAYVTILAVVALIASIAWVIAEPGYEPTLAVVGSMSALIAALLVDKKRARRAQQHQSVAKSSVGVQAGGDVTIGCIAGDKNAK